jgi:hypothetical protein
LAQSGHHDALNQCPLLGGKADIGSSTCYDAPSFASGASNEAAYVHLLGGTAAAWPLAVRAQQGERVRRIGVLMGGHETDSEAQTWKKAFELRLAELGWTDGRNVRIDYHWAGGDPAFSRTFAKEMLSIGPDVVLAVGTAALAALREETHTVPIVFTRISNPVERGFVATLAKPGGNVTGFTNFDATMSGKWLQTLRDIARSTSRVAMVANPKESDLGHYFRSFTAAATSSSIERLKHPFKILMNCRVPCAAEPKFLGAGRRLGADISLDRTHPPARPVNGQRTFATEFATERVGTSRDANGCGTT